MTTAELNIKIIKAVPADADLLSVLASTTFYEAYFLQDEPVALAGYINESFNSDSMIQQLNDPASHFYIIYVNGSAAGYAKLLSGSTDPGVKTVKTIELKRIYIVERYWGKGLGEELLEYCIHEAREKHCDSIWLGVWEQNERGRRFYEKHGFIKRGTLDFIYGDTVGINLVLEKIL